MFKKFKSFLHSNSVFVASLIVVWLVVIGALLMASQRARAEESFIGDETSCRSVAHTAAMMAAARIAGVKWSEVEPTLVPDMQAAKGDADSFIKNDDDVASIYQMAKSIWDSQASPERAASVVFKACMAAGVHRQMI